MGKYYKSYRDPVIERKWKVHPIWRGIGCITIIIMSVIAYAGAVEFIKFNQQARLIPLPNELYEPMGYVSYTIPDTSKTFGANLGDTLLGVPVFTVIFWLVGMGFFTFIYAVVYQMSGPPRYSGANVPPLKKGRRKKGSISHRH